MIDAVLPNLVERNQIRDDAVTEEDELKGRGASGTPYKSSLALSSVTAATKTVVFVSSVKLLTDPRCQSEDILKITSDAAIGTYTIDELVDDVTLKVRETILDAGSGNAWIAIGE